MDLDLNRLNIALLELTKVTSIVVPDPESSETNIDFITVVVAVGTVYKVVRSVVVKSTFSFLKLLDINLKRSFVHQLHPLILVEMLYLIFVQSHQDP